MSEQHEGPRSALAGSSSTSRPGFFAGLRYPFRGARFVYLQHPGLARFWIPPILLTGSALVGVGWLALSYHAEVLQSVWVTPEGEGFGVTLARWFHRFVEWVVAAVMLAAGAVVVALLTSVLAAPFNDALSEAVEKLQTGAGGPPTTLGKVVRDARRTVGLELGKLGIYLAIMLPLFLVSFLLPVAGPIVYAIAGFFLTAMFFAIDYVDWPASRREDSVRERRAAATRNLRPMLGLGIGVWLFMYVPLLNLFFMPAAVAGGTLLFLDLNPQPSDNSEDSTLSGPGEDGANA